MGIPITRSSYYSVSGYENCVVNDNWLLELDDSSSSILSGNQISFIISLFSRDISSRGSLVSHDIVSGSHSGIHTEHSSFCTGVVLMYGISTTATHISNWRCADVFSMVFYGISIPLAFMWAFVLRCLYLPDIAISLLHASQWYLLAFSLGVLSVFYGISIPIDFICFFVARCLLLPVAATLIPHGIQKYLPWL